MLEALAAFIDPENEDDDYARYSAAIAQVFGSKKQPKVIDYPLVNRDPHPTEFQQTKDSKKNSLRFLKSGIIEVKAICKGEELAFITDTKHVQLIRDHTWYISKKGDKMHVITNVENKKVFFHHLVTKFNTVEHRNGCNLDNREDNLVERGKTGKLTNLDIKRATRITVAENGDCMVEYPNGNEVEQEMFYVDVYKSKKKTLNEAQKYRNEKWNHMLTMDKGLYHTATYEDVVHNILHPDDYKKSHPFLCFFKKTEGIPVKYQLKVTPYHRYNGRYQPLKSIPNVHKTHDEKNYKATVRLNRSEKEVNLIQIDKYCEEKEAEKAAQQWIIQRQQELGIGQNMYRRLSMIVIEIQAKCDSETISFITDFAVLMKIKKKKWLIKLVDGNHYAYYVNRKKEHVYFHALLRDYENIVHINGKIFPKLKIVDFFLKVVHLTTESRILEMDLK